MILIDVRLEHPLLRDALQSVPEVEVQWVRNSQKSGDWEMLFWASGGNFDRFDAAVEADPTVNLVRSLDVGTQRLYQMTIVDQGAETDLYPVLVDIGGIVLAATVSNDGWHCRFGFPDQDGVNRFFELVEQHDVDFDVQRISEHHEEKTGDGVGLTEVQRDTLQTALEAGYFDVPRDVTLVELADTLGVSDSAASQRLRRGLAKLIEHEMDDFARGSTDDEGAVEMTR